MSTQEQPIDLTWLRIVMCQLRAAREPATIRFIDAMLMGAIDFAHLSGLITTQQQGILSQLRVNARAYAQGDTSC